MKRAIGIGIDAGGTFTKIVAATRTGRILAQQSLPTVPEGGPRRFVRRMADSVRVLERGLGAKGSVTLAIAGEVDLDRGALRCSPNLAAFEGFPLRRAMGAALRRRLSLHNDANMAGWGCYAFEFGRRFPSVVAITMGTGIGGGIVLDRRLFTGSTGSAAEIGHARIRDGSFPCRCGARGCLEAHAGSYGVLRTLREVLRERPRAASALRALRRIEPKDVSEAARRGDRVAREVWERVGRALGQGIVNLVYLLNPDAIALTGGLSSASPYFMGALRRVIRGESFSTPFSHTVIRASRHAGLGALGAALYSLEDAD